MIQVTPHIALSEDEIEETFVRASGPGGQNVNKVSTAVQLRFNVLRSQALSETVRARLIRLAGRKMTESGELLIDARRFRTQERNRQDALERLIALIRTAADIPKKRTATRPTLASKTRRLESKKRRAAVKSTRSGRISED